MASRSGGGLAGSRGGQPVPEPRPLVLPIALLSLSPSSRSMSQVSLAFCCHLSVPLGTSQCAAGDTLLHRLAATDVGGTRSWPRRPRCWPTPPCPPSSSLGNHHRLPLPQQRHIRVRPAAADRVPPLRPPLPCSRPTPGLRWLRAPTGIYWVRPCRSAHQRPKD